MKDLFDVRGTPTTAASRVRDGHIAADDAPAIALLRQAGAVFVGKTNLHEFAFGTTNEDSAFGPARNPHDVTRSPGGSSGGSAASVAAGMALATLGTDTGGSIRIPAAACGIVGLKPTYGEIQTDGVVPLSRTLDHAGPLTRDVTDAWHVYHALLGQPAARPLSAAACRHAPSGGARRVFLRRARRRGANEVRSVAGRAAQGGSANRRGPRSLMPIASSPIYLHIVLSDAAAYHAADAGRDGRPLHEAGASAIGNGTVHPRRGLRAGARRPGGVASRGRCCAGGARGDRLADAADSRATDRREHGPGGIEG